MDLLSGSADRADAQSALVEALALAGRMDECLSVGSELLQALATGERGSSLVLAETHLALAQAAVEASLVGQWPPPTWTRRRTCRLSR